MTTFSIHTLESAPAESVPSLRTLEQGLGFVPNLAATMAESPTLIGGFVDLRKTLAGGELTGVEREIVALAVSFENDCDYCLAAHSAFALMQNAEPDAVAAARAGDPLADPRLAALYQFARCLVRAKGQVSEDETRALLDAGFSRSALFELVAQAGHTTIANFAHSISNAPIDRAFATEEVAAAL